MMESSIDLSDYFTTGLAWGITIIGLLIGLFTSMVPFLPGHIIILATAVLHRLMLGKDASGLMWWSFLILIALIFISQIIEILSASIGAKRFGASRWGMLGSFIGALIGMFFFPIGLLVGPLLGTLIGEIFFAKKHPHPALLSGIGSVTGSVLSIGVNFIFAVMMAMWILVDALWIG